MEFGDILDAWDKQKAQAEKAKKPGPGKPCGEAAVGEDAAGETASSGETRRIDPVTAWLRVNGIYDKDADTRETSVEAAAARRRRLLGKAPDASLDLHGLTRDEAWVSLETFFETARRQGFEKLLVIHGKGNHSEGDAVLKQTVRQFLEQCPFAGETGPGSRELGGSGAVWVLLKTGKTGRNPEDQPLRNGDEEFAGP
jgi:DNA-nicking Smr family endonuclease